MILKNFHKFVIAVAIATPAFASLQVLDPDIYQSELDYVRAKDSSRIYQPSLRTFTQNEWNTYVSSQELFKPESDYLLQMTRNTFETPDVVFNAQLKNFFNLHNSRPLSFLELNAKSDPFFTSANGIYAPHSFSGMGMQFYAETFQFFSFDLKPYFLFHDDPGVTHATLKEVYGSIHINRLSIDIGKAALHWGYGAYQPMVFSDDTKPFFMIRLRNNEEIEFDHGPLSVLGKIKFEMVYGWLDQFRRFANGNIIASTFSFQPTNRVHFHLTQSVLFGGEGAPTDSPAILFSEKFVGNTTVNAANRNFTFGIRYRIPKLEIEPYADIYVEDCCGSPPINRRDMLNLIGVYIPPMDANKKFDLALEWVRTNYITYKHESFIYTQSQHVLGHPIGPDGSGVYLIGRYFHSKQLQFDNMLAYEIRGRDGFGSKKQDIRLVVPGFEAAEKRYRAEQFISWFAHPRWKWTVHLGGERVHNLGYQLSASKWQGIVGLESAYNF